MTNFPEDIDTDETLPRVDDNITEIGSDAINALRDAMFAVEEEIGINPSGSLQSLADFLDVSFNSNGTIKASALTSVGLVTLPITNNQVGDSAGIKEFKLDLDYNTTDLHTLIISNTALINSLTTFSNTTNSNLLTHIAGGTLLADGSTSARHVASHIDLNATPSDTRDVSFVWNGLQDKDGNLRTADTVAEALDQINDELVNHQNLTSVDPEAAHPAAAISVDNTNFTELPAVNDVQEALDAIDDLEVVNLGLHRATMHSNGIPKAARSEACVGPDGYNTNIVPVTPIAAHVSHGGAAPVDDSTTGDDIVQFMPDNSNFIFDSQFAKVRVGDYIKVNYGDSNEYTFEVESVRFTPGSEWVVRINGTNVFDTDGYTALARIDRPKFDPDIFGTLAVASANNNINANLLPSLIVSHPRAASVLGVGFNPDKLDENHYNLYLNLYPTGNPSDRIIQLPAIDVTGNAGTTPGRYTLRSVVEATNDAFRAAGYNYRFIAFEHEGEFGIALSDAINCASFSIINGIISGSSIAVGAFTDNVVSDVAIAGGSDPLGFSINAANVASPDYVSTFPSAEGALFSTNIITSKKDRNYTVNGARRTGFANTWAATLDTHGDGYWEATVKDSILVGITTVKTTYRVPLDLRPAGLKPGKTLVVQPVVAFDDADYKDADYGRFFIESVFFDDCGGPDPATEITVVNSIHSTGNAIGSFAVIGLDVLIYFSEDTIGFNDHNVADAAAPGNDFIRFHEAYIDDEGNTFSHERARMVEQSGSGSNLDTSKWHIRDVSPKLRGYIDDGATGPERFLRLYILRSSTSTGEFDGYIGKRDPLTANISRVGPIATGKKNVVTRFYDETNIDYIDFEYVEPIGTGSPGDDIVPSGVKRYVDIEVYPSLRLNDEHMLLAKCEIKPSGGFAKVQGLSDGRQFGNVSEKDLSSSAIDFIQSGDRLLHSNGIIRGLGFFNTDPDNEKKLFFDGGVALVNGSIAMVNNSSIVIPEIQTEGAGLPETLTWAVVIREGGQLDSILITSSKDAFFATTPGGATAYLVDSDTFANLINTRKDVTPIALVNVTIASVTINTIEDARRFVFNESQNIPFTWVPEPIRDISDESGREDIIAGHFHTFDAVKSWVNNYNSINNIIKVKGRILIDNTAVGANGSLDMSDFINPVTFEGDGGIFDIDMDTGIILGSNITFRNLTFTYKPDSADVTDLINTGQGALYASVAAGEILENVIIDNCIFDSVEGRASYINIELAGNSVLHNVKITNNLFKDPSVTAFFGAISIVNTNNEGSVTKPALILDTTIENNIGNKNQGIYLGAINTNSTGNFVGPGTHMFGTSIRNNKCGIIGYFISSTKVENDFFLSGGAGALRDRVSSLTIEGNSCSVITHVRADGKIWNSSTGNDTILYSTGHVQIINNICSWIDIALVEATSEEKSSIIVSDNMLQANDTTIFNTYAKTNNPLNIAINVAETAHIGKANIANNTTNSNTVSDGATDTTYTYDIGISCGAPGIVNNNIINGLTNSTGAGISIGAANDVAVNYIVQGNQIYRGSSDIVAYINVGAVNVFGAVASPLSSGIIVDNAFDSRFISGSNTSVINIPSSIDKRWSAERNINQTVTEIIHPQTFGHVSFAAADVVPTLPGGLSGATYNVIGKTATGGASADGALVITYGTSSGSVTVRWIVHMNAVLPRNIRFISAELSFAVDNTSNWSGSSNIALTIQQEFGGLASVIGTDSKNLDNGIPGDYEDVLSVDLTSDDYRNTDDDFIDARVLISAENTSGSEAEIVAFGVLEITYTW